MTRTNSKQTTLIKPLFALAAISITIGCGSSGNHVLTADSFQAVITRVAMRDGIELHTEILLPAEPAASGVPTLLLRTPYDLPTLPLGGLVPADAGADNSDTEDQLDDENEKEDPDAVREAWRPVTDRGYAIVFQNLRGTQSSAGSNLTFASERADGVDTVNWIREQAWSNGRIGAIGDSAAGFSAHLLAAEQPAGLQATFSQASCGDIWDSAILPEHGGMKLEAYLAFMLGQSLELGDEHLAMLGIGDDGIESAQESVQQALGNLFGDDPVAQFDALTVQPFIDYPGVSTLLPQWPVVLEESNRADLASYFDTRGQSAVPGMHVTLWQDIFAECLLGDFQSLVNGPAEQRLLVLDGSHYQIDEQETWPYLPMLDWFDRHLQDAPDDAIPTVQFAVQSVNSLAQLSKELIDAETWPPANTVEQSWYLDNGAALSQSMPVGPVQFSIVSDPSQPQTTLGGRNLIIDSGISVQPLIEDPAAVQIFVTDVFDSDFTIAGEVNLESIIAANVPDVDVHARLVEVTPEGNRILIVAGMQRARFRQGLLAPMDLLLEQTTPLNVSLGNIAHRVTAGNRLQLELTPSNFPAWDLNPQTGGSIYNATGQRVGVIQIRESRLSIPVMQ